MLRSAFKHFISFFGASVLLLSASFASAQENSNPYTLMEQSSEKLFGQITAEQSKIKADPNYLKTIVKETLMPYVHVKYAGSLVLGRQLSTINSEERNAFFNAFAEFIEQAYAQALTLYSNQKIDIEKAKPINANIVNIKVQVIQTNGAAPINLNFFWRKNSKSGEWQVYDMAVEGVSMIDTKRQEWSPILRKDGINALIQQVKNAANTPVTLTKQE